MISPKRPALINAIIERGYMDQWDIDLLRNKVYIDGIMIREQAEWLLAVHTVTGCSDENFTSLFVEALTDFIVYQEGRCGAVVDEQAAWLIDALTDGAGAVSSLGFDLVDSIVSEATQLSPLLEAFHAENRYASTACWPAIQPVGASAGALMH